MVPGFLFLCLIYWNGKSSIFQMVCNTKIVCILKPWRQGVLSSVYYVFYWRVPSENKVTRNKKEGRHWLWVFRGKLSNAILSFKIKESVFRKCIRLHTYLIAQLFIHLIWLHKHLSSESSVPGCVLSPEGSLGSKVTSLPTGCLPGSGGETHSHIIYTKSGVFWKCVERAQTTY